MTGYVFDPAPQVSAAVVGTAARYPVRRIYCVGRNYADHVREMGLDPDREPPFFFAKPVDALVEGDRSVPYPPETADFQHEIELVIAIGKAGRNVPVDAALGHVFGYAVGVDLTRRDTQIAARKSGRPWEHGKSFDQSAPMGPVWPVSAVGHPRHGEIWLEVNGKRRQTGNLDQLIWSVAEIVSALSRGWELRPGDLVFSGTPAGVGPVEAGDRIRGSIASLGDISFTIGPK
jgi:fumarylpyruvate hydrolase